MDTSVSYTRAALPQQPHPVQNDDERCAYIGKDRLPERGLTGNGQPENHRLDAEGEDDVLDDDVARASRQPDGIAYPLEVVAHERDRSEEHTSELQSRGHLVCRLLLDTKH